MNIFYDFNSFILKKLRNFFTYINIIQNNFNLKYWNSKFLNVYHFIQAKPIISIRKLKKVNGKNLNV